ncbi:MAG: tripartite tricarboxylate transporter TctB family protein [Pseudomonadota bacterium]
MGRLSQDTVIAILLLLISGGLMLASFDIREPDYGQLSPATWPRVVVGVLGFLSFLYLIQSLRGAGTPASVDVPKSGDGTASSGQDVEPAGVAGFFGYWRNVIWCFSLFLLYLLTMPYIGMLIGGVSFAFLLLNALGGWQPRQLLLHAVIAIVAVGGMWALFTFGLRVPLPTGMILPRF